MIAALLVQRSRRRRAEAELREGDFRFQSMADMAPVLIWIVDADRNVTFFNKGWRDFVGDAWPGTPSDSWTSCVHPDDLPSALAVYEQGVAARSAFTVECRLRRHDGDYRWMLCAGVPRFTLAGHFLGYIGSCSDINAMREGESEKQRLHAALAHVGRVATMGELTASLAHELYQPLAAILTNADTAQKLLESGSPPLDQLQEILTDIQTDDKRAAAIIRGVRSLLQRHEIAKTTIELNETVGEIVRLMRQEAIERGVEMQFERPEESLRVSADRVQLQQVVLNLLLNGFEAMGSPIRQRAPHHASDRKHRRRSHHRCVRLRSGRSGRQALAGVRAVLYDQERGARNGTLDHTLHRRRPRRACVGSEQSRRRCNVLHQPAVGAVTSRGGLL